MVSPPALRSLSIPVLDVDVLSWPINEWTLKIYTEWKYPKLPVNEELQGLLLSRLDREHYKLIRDLDHVVKGTAQAVEQWKAKKGALFQTGTD
jgi:hypothetical protein